MSEEELEPLKPCPFCGCETIVLFSINQYGGDWLVAQCNFCKVEAGEVTAYKIQIISKWNRREVPRGISLEERMLHDFVLKITNQ